MFIFAHCYFNICFLSPTSPSPPSAHRTQCPPPRWPLHQPAQPLVGPPRFIYFPIIDQTTAEDAAVARTAHRVMVELSLGRRCYIHCWGGHGRAGTLAAVVLGAMFDLTPQEALLRLQLCHDTRADPQRTRSPQTVEQQEQVRAYIPYRCSA